jgi:hypothetical protein
MRRFPIRLCGLILLALAAGWLFWPQSDRRDYTMPDGSIIRVEKVSYGMVENINFRSPFEKLMDRLPASWQKKLPGYKAPDGVLEVWAVAAKDSDLIPHTNGLTDDSHAGLYIYISRRNPAGGYRDVLAGMRDSWA